MLNANLAFTHNRFIILKGDLYEYYYCIGKEL